MSIEAMTWAMNAKRTGPMSDGARLVLIALADYANADGRNAFPAKRRLAERLGVTERTIQRHLAALRESGHIVLGDARHVSHYLADRRPTVYDLALDRPVEPRHETRERGDSPVIGETALSPGGETERARAGRQPCLPNQELNPPYQPHPPKPPRLDGPRARPHAQALPGLRRALHQDPPLSRPHRPTGAHAGRLPRARRASPPRGPGRRGRQGPDPPHPRPHQGATSMNLTDLDARLRQHRQDLAETINAVIVEQTPRAVLDDLAITHHGLTQAMHHLAVHAKITALLDPTPPAEDTPHE